MECKIMLTSQTIKRLIIALTGRIYGQNVAGAIGLYGNAVLGAAGATGTSAGDWVLSGSGGEYTFTLANPALNQQVASLDYVQVEGFTPRAAGATETCIAGVTGYGQNASGQWYINVQTETLTTGALLASPPTGFTFEVRAAVSYNYSAYAL
jgi:hypothetical protein